MANINATQVRVFEHGGKIRIGSDTVLNVEKGTLRFKPGMWERKRFTDRGTIQDTLEGDEQHTTLSFDVKFTSISGASDLYKALVAQKSSYDGLAKQHSIVFEFPKFKGAATTNVDTVTFAKAVIDEVEVQAGDMFDTIRVSATDDEANPAVGTL